MHYILAALGGIAAITMGAHAHFVLQVPTSLGFDDAKEGTAPCGNLDIKDRSKGVTEWPTGGYPIQIISTHPDAEWEIQAALLNDTGTFKKLVPRVRQKGLGTFCMPQVPGLAAWKGQDAVFQMIQHAVDGALYQVREPREAVLLPPSSSQRCAPCSPRSQCAAVKFVDGAAGAVPSSCKNSTDVSAVFLTDSSGTPSQTPTSTGGTPAQTSAKGAAPALRRSSLAVVSWGLSAVLLGLFC